VGVENVSVIVAGWMKICPLEHSNIIIEPPPCELQTRKSYIETTLYHHYHRQDAEHAYGDHIDDTTSSRSLQKLCNTLRILINRDSFPMTKRTTLILTITTNPRRILVYTKITITRH
jgi:hypothetical protein